MASHAEGDIYTETLAVFDRVGDRNEPLTTPEVANALDENRRTVYKRLQKLVDRGKLETKGTGANSRVWWRPSRGSSDSSGTTGISIDGDWHTDGGAELPTLIDEAPDGILVHDVDGTILAVNGTLTEKLGYTRDELLSMCVFDFEIGLDEDTLRKRWQSMESGPVRKLEFEGTHRRKDGSTYPAEIWVSKITTDGTTRDRFVGFVRDVTHRKERERKLQETTGQLRGILDAVEAAIFMKDSDGTYLRMNQNCRDLFGIDDERDVTGLTDFDLVPEDVANQYLADDRRVLETNETIEIEEKVPTTDGTRTYLTRKTPICDDTGEPYAVCAVATDISNRKAHERELERRRERLNALNNLHDVVREVTDAVIDQSTRREIERAVCEGLAQSDSYRFAWVCAIDSGTDSVQARAEAGVDGYLDEIPFSVDPTEPTGRGPTGRAIRTQEMQVTQNVYEDPDYEPWYDDAREYGYRSSASIPIVHEGTLYGVIGLHSERAYAFSEEEREVVSQLGDVVGHAIAAVERKRALMSDEIVELEFRMHDIEALDVSLPDGDTVVFDRVVPIDDGSYLEYGVATGNAIGIVEQFVDAESTPHSGPVNVVARNGDETRFEVTLNEPAFLPEIITRGGRLHEARIENGNYYIRIHLPPSTEVSTVVDAITDAFPGTETITRRQIVRTPSTPQQIRRTLANRLTERQWTALEAGYAAGFFEWPRDSSGEDVAESLGIGASTFHQHVRKAERKLMQEIFEDTYTGRRND